MTQPDKQQFIVLPPAYHPYNANSPSEHSSEGGVLSNGKSNAGVGGEAGINGQYHAGNGGSSPVIAQEQHRAQKLFGLNKPTGGSSVQDLGTPGGEGAVGVKQQISVLVGNQEAGSNGVAPDAGSGKMGGQPLGKVGDGRLRARIRRDLGQRASATQSAMSRLRSGPRIPGMAQ